MLCIRAMPGRILKKKTIMQNEIFNFDIFPCMGFELRWFGLNERMYVCEYFANTNSVDSISAQTSVTLFAEGYFDFTFTAVRFQIHLPAR